MESRFIAAKKIMDFYLESLEEDETQNSKFALQYAHLRMMDFRANCMLDTLLTYDLKVE